MNNCEVSKLSPGMILGKPVRDGMNELIFDAGTELDEEKIRTIRMWGVKSVTVVSKAEIRAVKELERLEAKPDTAVLIKRLSERFEGHMNNPVMKKIFEMEQDILRGGGA